MRDFVGETFEFDIIWVWRRNQSGEDHGRMGSVTNFLLQGNTVAVEEILLCLDGVAAEDRGEQILLVCL